MSATPVEVNEAVAAALAEFDQAVSQLEVKARAQTEVDKKVSSESSEEANTKKCDGTRSIDLLKIFCIDLIFVCHLENIDKATLLLELDKKNLLSLLSLIMPLAEKCYTLRDEKTFPSNGKALTQAFYKKFPDASISDSANKRRAESVASVEEVATVLGYSIIRTKKRLKADDKLREHLQKVVPELFRAGVTSSAEVRQVFFMKFLFPSLAIFAGLNADSTPDAHDEVVALLNMMMILKKKITKPIQPAPQAPRGDGKPLVLSANANVVVSPANRSAALSGAVVRRASMPALPLHK